MMNKQQSTKNVRGLACISAKLGPPENEGNGEGGAVKEGEGEGEGGAAACVVMGEFLSVASCRNSAIHEAILSEPVAVMLVCVIVIWNNCFEMLLRGIVPSN